MVIGDQITTSPKHSASCTLPADSALVTGRLERFGGSSPHRAKTGPIFRRVCLRGVMTVPAGTPDLILRRADPLGLQCAQPLVFVVRHLSFFVISRPSPSRHSTVTDLARLRGLSTSYPLISAISMANSCNGTDVDDRAHQRRAFGTPEHDIRITFIIAGALFGDGDDERASALDLLDAGPHLGVQHVTAAIGRHNEHHQLSLIDQRYRAVPACVSSTHWILAGMPLSESMI